MYKLATRFLHSQYILYELLFIHMKRKKGEKKKLDKGTSMQYNTYIIYIQFIIYSSIPSVNVLHILLKFFQA